MDEANRTVRPATGTRRSQDVLNDRFDHFLTGPHREEHEAIMTGLDRIETRLSLHED